MNGHADALIRVASATDFPPVLRAAIESSGGDPVAAGARLILTHLGQWLSDEADRTVELTSLDDHEPWSSGAGAAYGAAVCYTGDILNRMNEGMSVVDALAATEEDYRRPDDDEPVADVVAAFESGAKGYTTPPQSRADGAS